MMSRMYPDYRAILSDRFAEMSLNEIAAKRRTAKKTILKAEKMASAAGITSENLGSLTDEELEAIINPQSGIHASSRPKPETEPLYYASLQPGITRVQLWHNYCEECHSVNKNPLKYAQFCRYLQKESQKRRATCDLYAKPGLMAVMWLPVPVRYNPECRTDKAYLLAGFFPYSQKVILKPSKTRQASDWADALNRIITDIGRSPSALYLPSSAHLYFYFSTSEGETALCGQAARLLEHYGIGLTDHVSDTIEAEINDAVALLSSGISSLDFNGYNTITEKVNCLASEFNNTCLKNGSTRESLFTSEEKPFLQKISNGMYEPYIEKTVQVLYNYHISFEGNYYSVPWQLYRAGDLILHITKHQIEIYEQSRLIASHERIIGHKGFYQTSPQHVPSNDVLKSLPWNGDRFINWAAKIGPETASLIQNILKSKRYETQTYHSCLSLIKLADKYGDKRLESACKADSKLPTGAYGRISHALAKNE